MSDQTNANQLVQRIRDDVMCLEGVAFGAARECDTLRAQLAQERTDSQARIAQLGGVIAKTAAEREEWRNRHVADVQDLAERLKDAEARATALEAARDKVLPHNKDCDPEGPGNTIDWMRHAFDAAVTRAEGR